MTGRLSQYLNEAVWLITEDRFAAIRGAIDAIEAGTVVLDGPKIETPAPYAIVEGRERATYDHDQPARGSNEAKAVLVVPVCGVIYPRMGGAVPMSGGTSLQSLMGTMRRAVADPGISSIILDVDSPGGMATGLPEAADELRAMRGIKPISAIANFQMASAAYFLGSQADEVIASPSSTLGSIGIVAQYVSQEKALADAGIVVQTLRIPDKKAEADGVSPLSDEAMKYRMAQLKRAYDTFTGAVAAGMRIDRAKVEKDFGRGRSLDAQSAVKAGMAHRVASFDTVLLEHMSGRAAKMRGFRRSQGRPGMLDELSALTDESRGRLDRAGDRIEAERKVAAKAQRDALARRWGFAN